MTIIKSFSVGTGDMFYIKHNSDNFTIIDCNLSFRDEKIIVDELIKESALKGIKRFISTHPDEDHISGLSYIEKHMGIDNFYCTKNNATKEYPTEDFLKYCELRDGSKAFHIEKNVSRKWMNKKDDQRGSSGINILWPDTDNIDYKEVLTKIKNGESPNNASAIIKYSLESGVTALWMGDLEKEFMEKIEGEIDWPEVDLLFAPHHGRTSGKIPKSILEKLNPKLVIIGQAPSEHLNYYDDYNKITQNSTGDIVFDCVTNKVHVHVKNEFYQAKCLDEEYVNNLKDYNYIGTLNLS